MELFDMDEMERRLERRLDAQSDDLKEHMSLLTEPIRIQTTKTNGRVSIMEKMVWMAAGAVIILTPVTYYLASEVTDLKEHQSDIIRAEIRQALDDKN